MYAPGVTCGTPGRTLNPLYRPSDQSPLLGISAGQHEASYFAFTQSKVSLSSGEYNDLKDSWLEWDVRNLLTLIFPSFIFQIFTLTSALLVTGTVF